jgi:hypothetical protein
MTPARSPQEPPIPLLPSPILFSPPHPPPSPYPVPTRRPNRLPRCSMRLKQVHGRQPPAPRPRPACRPFGPARAGLARGSAAAGQTAGRGRCSFGAGRRCCFRGPLGGPVPGRQRARVRGRILSREPALVAAFLGYDQTYLRAKFMVVF